MNYIFIVILIYVIPFCLSFNSKNCGGTYTDEQAHINFNRSVKEVEDLPNCEWSISVAQNKSIMLSIKKADVHYGYKFSIFDGTSDSDTSLTEKTDNTYSSLYSSEMRRNYLSSKNHMFIKFRATEFYTFSHLNTQRNYSIEMSYQTVSSGCGGTYSGSEGLILSPGYPNNYYNNIECKWNIKVPENQTIIFIFEDFSTESEKDVLKFDDFGMVRFSGKEKPANFISNTNSKEIYFETDGDITDRGFKIIYKAMVLETNKTFLIFTTDAIIRSNSSVNHTIAVTGHKVSKYFGYDLRKETIFWFEEHSHQIHIKFSNFTTKMVSIEGKPNSMAFDYIHDHIYWIDVISKTIKVMDINDRNNIIYTIVDLNNENPRDLIINVKKYILVWSDIGFEPKIMFSNLDGSNPQILYSESRQAIHLTIDYENEKYYFVDLTDHSLYSIDFNGNNETFYIKSTLYLDIINSISVLNNDLYLSNEYMIYRIPALDLQILRAHVIYKVHYFPNYEVDEFIMSTAKDIQRHKINGFRVIDPMEQPIVDNKCSSNLCPHICLPKSQYLYNCVTPNDNYNDSKIKKIDPEQSLRIEAYREEITNKLSIVNTILIVFLVLVIIFMSLTVFRIKREMIGINESHYYRAPDSRLSIQENIEEDVPISDNTRSFQNLLQLEEK